MNTVIIGLGEVGRAHFNLLKPHHDVLGLDIKSGWTVGFDGEVPSEEEMHSWADLVLIATPWLGDNFVPMVHDYVRRFAPKYINVLTSVPPGTCQQIEDETGIPTVHSTTRGLHPNLERGLLNITKHVGGSCAVEVAEYYEKAGIDCEVHRRAETTELAHLLLNIDYAVALAFADEKARICRQFGVDYIESVMDYTRTNNAGYAALDHSSKSRPVLTPPNGRIGGHCLVQNAEMLAPLMRAAGVKVPLVEMIENFNKGA